MTEIISPAGGSGSVGGGGEGGERKIERRVEGGNAEIRGVRELGRECDGAIAKEEEWEKEERRKGGRKEGRKKEQDLVDG